ncbi:thioredoxin domain-containing protein [Saxibacter everestensis]|uniref:Thioredoxin domain-containing protein n=1 Tax=Saxibacter everestensis TaxID=2909229 RepID=A0ABY8QU75_9MICO|nr:thioredoxin domain-containing protein [Brevibacteriaceae bacterium ZFBP1038]
MATSKKKQPSPAGKAQQRTAAREKARQIAEVQERKERRGKLILRGGVAAVVLALVVVVGVVIVNANKPAVAPVNYANEGITFGKGGEVIASPDAEKGDIPEGLTPASENLNEGAAHLKVYLDFQCPVCKTFEELNGANINSWAQAGNVSIEYVPLPFLDRMSGGTKYSTRSANAAACLSDVAPDKYLGYMTTLFENQPEEGGTGLPDEDLITYAKEAGVDVQAPIKTKSEDDEPVSFTECVTNLHYGDWVKTVNDAAAEDNVSATPTVLLNGEDVGTDWQDPEAFAFTVLKAAGALDEGADPTESPSVAPTK